MNRGNLIVLLVTFVGCIAFWVGLGVVVMKLI